MGRSGEDQQWLLRIQSNDQQALECLMRKYYTILYLYALKFTKNEALIMISIREVFVGMWQKRCFADRIDSPQAYLLTSMKNQLGVGQPIQAAAVVNELASKEEGFDGYPLFEN